MAGADCIPAPLDRVGFEDAPCALARVVTACSLKFSFQAIDVRRIDWPVPKHDVCRECKRTLKSFDHG
jgi:hypothetical protein